MHEMAIRRAIQAAQNTYVPLRKNFFDHEVDRVARDLVGAILLIDGVGGLAIPKLSLSQQDPSVHAGQDSAFSQHRVCYGRVTPAGVVQHQSRQYRERRTRAVADLDNDALGRHDGAWP